MDELEQLARARPVGPPSPHTIARSRAALIQLAGGRPARNRRVMHLRARIAVPAAATVLAVATGVAVTMLVSGTGAPNAAPSASSMPTAARAWDSANAPQLLLVAAEQAQQEGAPGTGTYWVSTVEHGSLLPVGADNNRYVLRARRTEITWKPLLPGKDVVFVSRWAGAEPLSDRDKAAWRAAGSPTSWPIDPPPGCPPDPGNVYTAEPGGPERVVRRPPDAQLFMVAWESLTAEQVRALPSDPDALRTWLLGVIDKQNLPRANPVQAGESLFDAVVSMMLNLPITPAVRSAAFRVLAGVPGIKSHGAVTDAKGRSGVAVSVENNDTIEERRADPGGPREVTLILDPNTGAVLGRQVRALRPADYMSWVPAGAIQSYDLVEHHRWTNDEPPATPRTTDNRPRATAMPGAC